MKRIIVSLIVIVVFFSLFCRNVYAWDTEPDDAEMIEIANAAYEAALRLVYPMEVYASHSSEYDPNDSWLIFPEDSDPETAACAWTVYAFPAVGAFSTWDELYKYLKMYFTDENIESLRSILPLMKVREDGRILRCDTTLKDHMDIIESLHVSADCSVISRTDSMITIRYSYIGVNECGALLTGDCHFECIDGEWLFTDYMFPGILCNVGGTSDAAGNVRKSGFSGSFAVIMLLACVICASAYSSWRKKGIKAGFVTFMVLCICCSVIVLYSCGRDKTPAVSDVTTEAPTDAPSPSPSPSPEPTIEPTPSSEPEKIDFTYKKINGPQIIITGYNGTGPSVTVPETINGIPVVRIEGNIFAECADADQIEEITVSAPQCLISEKAFTNCPNIKKLTITGKMTYPLSKLFGQAPSSLITVSCDSPTLPSAAFKNCTSLQTAVLNKSLEIIPEEAFSQCTGLQSVQAGGVRIVERNAFYQCSSLMIDITSLGPLEEIHNESFGLCTSLTSITLPETLKNIYAGAFMDCSGVKIINYNAVNAESTGYDSPFMDMNGVESLNIGNQVRVIPGLLFLGCNFKLQEFIIPGNVETIESLAFLDFGPIQKIVVSEGVRSIGRGAFSSIAQLKEISLPGTLTDIGDNIFRYCTDLETVSLGEGISAIGCRMFGDCTALSEITLPASVQTIGERAFEYCINLEKVSFAGGNDSAANVSVSDRAFYICLNLDPKTADLNYKSAGTGAFFGVGKWA